MISRQIQRQGRLWAGVERHGYTMRFNPMRRNAAFMACCGDGHPPLPQKKNKASQWIRSLEHLMQKGMLIRLVPSYKIKQIDPGG